MRIFITMSFFVPFFICNRYIHVETEQLLMKYGRLPVDFFNDVSKFAAETLLTISHILLFLYNTCAEPENSNA